MKFEVEVGEEVANAAGHVGLYTRVLTKLGFTILASSTSSSSTSIDLNLNVMELSALVLVVHAG